MNNHLKEMKDSYFAHFLVATRLALYSFTACLVLIIHAFVPTWFPTTGSQIFSKIQKILDERNQRMVG